MPDNERQQWKTMLWLGIDSLDYRTEIMCEKTACERSEPGRLVRLWEG